VVEDPEGSSDYEVSLEAPAAIGEMIKVEISGATFDIMIAYNEVT